MLVHLLVCAAQTIHIFTDLFHRNQGLFLNMPDFHLISLQIPVKLTTRASLRGNDCLRSVLQCVFFFFFNNQSVQSERPDSYPSPKVFD